MESSKTLLPLGHGAMNPAPRISVEQFLHSLARTPNPKRFRERRERLQQNLRVIQDMRNVRNIGSSTNTGVTSTEYARTAPDGMLAIEPRPDIEECQHMSDIELSALEVEKTRQLVSEILFNPLAVAVNEVQLKRVSKGSDIDADFSARQTLVAPKNLFRLHGQHKRHVHRHGSLISVKANKSDEFKQLKGNRRPEPDQEEIDMANPDSLILSDLEVIQSHYADERVIGMHEVKGKPESLTIGDAQHFAVQPPQNDLHLATGQLKRSVLKPKNLMKTYVDGKSSSFEQSKTKIKVPRTLPVEELQIAFNRAPSNSIYDSDFATINSDDDPVENFSSFPSQSPGRRSKQQNVKQTSKKRKALGKTQQNILKPNADELCKYKLPKTREMSPNKAKRLRVNTKCSDGFEGSEALPTGRTMPVRLPRRYPQPSGQTVVYVPELALVSSRDCTVNIESIPEFQREDFQSEEVAKCDCEQHDVVMEGLAATKPGPPGPLKESSTQVKPAGSLQVRTWKSLASPVYKGHDYMNENVNITTAATVCVSTRRVTYSDNVDVIQTLRMISAPIIARSSSDSETSDSSATDDEEDGASDDNEDDVYRDSSGSSSVRSERNEQQSREEGNCEDETIETVDVCYSHLMPRKTTFQKTRQVKDVNNDESERTKQLALNDQSRGKYADGVNPSINSRNAPFVKSSENLAGIWKVEECHSQNMTTEGYPWRPKIPVISSRLIEVDDGILEYPISPNSAAEQHTENSQQGRQSQVCVELGDSSLQVLCNNGCEQSRSQDGNLDSPQIDFRYKVAEDCPTYLALALESFNSASPRNPGLGRSKSVPSEQKLQEGFPTSSLNTKSAFRSIAYPLNCHLSNVKDTGSGISARSVSIGSGTSHAWGRTRKLPLIPPFLRD